MKVFILIATIAVVSANTAYPAPRYSAPTYSAPAPAYQPAAPAYKPDYQPQTYPAQPYSFEWAVKDVESYNDYSHSESSDGKVTTGSYRVVLPDGRTQIVTYRADSYGYVADVKYVGEARYPEYKPAATYSAPAYKAPAAPAAPAYKAPETPSYPTPAVYRTPKY
ncbi:hypothetical protein DAPPUDRAFT_301586 [Daphnia pulex]|uniref:Cuticle protein n=1 Tax=Daphnia pulex TaxID=6669 RepID=E9GA43_DAPPU|nr:hypothetical protein DAPPUDRAFT_301586 [Daphnia pulex]|eukprot:EFX83675.1 hypothetical protein DAPPUDRAFT_301586 [Daphnia pulex]